MSYYKAKFTKASQKDGDRVTLRVSEIHTTIDNDVINSLYDREFTFDFEFGNQFILNVGGVDIVFTSNRQDKTTLTTRGFPRKLKLPSVGKPVYYEISKVQPI